MSFVTTQPDALNYAAGKLEGIGTSLAGQNTSAAASTTGVAPAAADEVSALQATQFNAYGTLYQQISADATAIHQAFVQMLGTSAGSYGATEAANQGATGLGNLGFSPLGQLSQFGQFGIIPGAMSGGSMDGMYVGSPLLGSVSTFQSLAQAGTGAGAGAGAGADAGAGAVSAASAESAGLPAAGASSVGAAPVLAGVGQAPTVGRLSVPPSWAAANGLSATGGTPATLTGLTSAAAPHGAPITTVPGGLPSGASAGRVSGLGTPRYRLKSTVMPKSTFV